MKKKKLKVRKKVWLIFILMIFIGIGIYASINIYNNYLYKQTNEYKLTNLGYTKKEIKLLEEKTSKEYIDSLITSTEKNEDIIGIISEKYYLKENLTRYLAFIENNLEMTSKDVITLVNTNNDYDYYDHDLNTDTSKGCLLIVNKFYHLESDYKPSDLVDINNKYFYGTNHQIRSEVYDAFKSMWEEANKEDIYLIINSSYRDFDSQVSVYDDFKNREGTTYADKYAARPGYSEHQTGLALDIFSKTHTTTSNFKDSPAHIWLQNNAHRFGFIERYKENEEHITGFSAESWHWRYVGVDVATYIHENKITFDEYYSFYLNN